MTDNAKARAGSGTFALSAPEDRYVPDEQREELYEFIRAHGFRVGSDQPHDYVETVEWSAEGPMRITRYALRDGRPYAQDGEVVMVTDEVPLRALPPAWIREALRG